MESFINFLNVQYSPPPEEVNTKDPSFVIICIFFILPDAKILKSCNDGVVPSGCRTGINKFSIIFTPYGNTAKVTVFIPHCTKFNLRIFFSQFCNKVLFTLAGRKVSPRAPSAWLHQRAKRILTGWHCILCNADTAGRVLKKRFSGAIFFEL